MHRLGALDALVRIVISWMNPEVIGGNLPPVVPASDFGSFFHRSGETQLERSWMDQGGGARSGRQLGATRHPGPRDSLPNDRGFV